MTTNRISLQLQKHGFTRIGYNLLDHPRPSRQGGGTGLIFTDFLSVRQHAAGKFQSFKYSEWKITSGTHRIHLIIVYRPPYSEVHSITTSVFLIEFADYLESTVLCTDQLLITSDLNLHVEVIDDSDACRFHELLESTGLDQHVRVPTHISGHTLDLIITRNSDQLIISFPCANYVFSDHMPVHCNVQIEQRTLKKTQISYRNLKSISIEALRDDLSQSALCKDMLSFNFNYLVHSYNDTLASILDRHAPLITKSVTKRPIVAWFNDKVKAAKLERRRAERKYKRTKLECDILVYKAKKNQATFEMKKARKESYTNFIQDNSHDPQKLCPDQQKHYSVVRSELNFQGYYDSRQLAKDIGDFFVQKIEVNRAKLDAAAPIVSTSDEFHPADSLSHLLF